MAQAEPHMPFEKEDRIREATMHEVGRFFQNAAERDWDGMVPPFIDWGRLHDCDGFIVAEYEGEIIGAVATSSQGMDGSTLPTIANVYVLRDFRRKGAGFRLLLDALKRLLGSGSSKAFCKAVSQAMMKNIEKLPPDLMQRLEYTADLQEDWPKVWRSRQETKGMD